MFSREINKLRQQALYGNDFTEQWRSREMIGQVMGHKDLSTTNTYLDSFGDAEIEKVTLKSLYNNKELKL